MFGKFKDMMSQAQMAQQLMKDKNFMAFISHPKVQELLRDPEFQEAVKKQDQSRLLSNPRFAALQQDPELAGLLKKTDIFKSMKPGL